MSEAEAIADLGARTLVVEKALEVLVYDLYRGQPGRLDEALKQFKGEVAKASANRVGDLADSYAATFADRLQKRRTWAGD